LIGAAVYICYIKNVVLSFAPKMWIMGYNFSLSLTKFP